MQEVIIYRNPAEAALWSALMTPEAFVIFAGAAVGLIALLLAASIVSSRTAWNSPLRTWIPLTVGALAWIATVLVMWV